MKVECPACSATFDTDSAEVMSIPNHTRFDLMVLTGNDLIENVRSFVSEKPETDEEPNKVVIIFTSDWERLGEPTHLLVPDRLTEKWFVRRIKDTSASGITPGWEN